MLEKISKENMYAPEIRGIFKFRPSASYYDFSPFKVILSKSGESYQGSVEFLRQQKQGMTGKSDDTSTVIFNISSTSLSHDTLSFVYGLGNGLMESLNMKGFITKAKGKPVIGIDKNIIEEFETPSLNPCMIDNNSQIASYKTGVPITPEMKKTLYETHRKNLIAELDSADKYDKPKINSSIIYIDSILLPNTKN